MALTKVSTPAIKDEAITLAKLLHGDSNSNGKFLRANNGADPTFETVNTDLVSDTSPQLGGNLDSNGNNITLGDSSSSNDDRIQIGAGSFGDLELYHDGTNSYIDNKTGDLKLRGGTNDILLQPVDTEIALKAIPNGAVELYYDNSKKFETTSSGGTLYGDWLADANFLLADNDKIKLGNGADLQIYHDGSNSYISEAGTGRLIINTNSLHLKNAASNEVMIATNEDGNVELWYDNVKKFETTSDGSTQYGNLTIPDNDAKIILKDGNNYIQFLNTNKEFKFMNAWGAGEFTFYPGGSERVRIDGDGLKFNGDTGSGNAIDDYEEGLWSPSLSSGTAVWYNQQWYTKIGRMVTCYLYMYAFSDTSSSTHVKVGGLPFACNQARESGFVFKVQGSPSLGSGATGVSGRIGVTGNSTQISLYRDFASSNGASLNHQHLSNAHISLTFTYPAAV